MIRITHPRPQAGRVRFLDVEFVDGVAEVDELHPVREQALFQHGFAIETHIVGVALEDLTVRELRDIAEVEGIDLPAKAKKHDIIALIQQAPLPIITDDGVFDAETLALQSRREFMGAHVVPLGPDED